MRIILVPEKAFKHYPSHEESFGGYLGQIAQESDQLVNAEVDSLSKFGQWCGTCTKSNAIVLVGSDESTQTYYFAGAGQGQPNRVEALEHLAIPRAKDFCQRMDFSWESLACFSDAFIPFRDTVDILAKSGLKTLYQPGGSKADDEIKSVAEELGVTMHLTGERHFWH